MDAVWQSGGGLLMQGGQPQMTVRADVEALQTAPQSPRMLAILAVDCSPPPREVGGMKTKIEDLKILIQALPTRADIGALIVRVEEAHGRDLEMIRGDLQVLSECAQMGRTYQRTWNSG